MELSKEDYKAYYEAMYAPVQTYKVEDTDAIVRGTFVAIFQDYRFDLISLIALPLDFLFRFLPMLIDRLEINASKPVFKPEEHFKLDKTYKANSKSNEQTIDSVIAHREHYNSLKNQYGSQNKALALKELRMYLYSNNLTLKAKITSKGNVNFGSKLNNLISKVIPEVTLKGKSISGDYNTYADKLKEIYQEDVRIIFS